jgi:hypothetical protein
MGVHSFTNATAREFLGFDSIALLQRALNAWHVPAVIRIGDNANVSKNFNVLEHLGIELIDSILDGVSIPYKKTKAKKELDELFDLLAKKG